MMSPSEFENLAGLAEERHAKMLAEARQDRLLKEAAGDHPQGHSVWQWLHHAVVDWTQHIHLHTHAGPRHSTQHR